MHYLLLSSFSAAPPPSFPTRFAVRDVYHRVCGASAPRMLRFRDFSRRGPPRYRFRVVARLRATKCPLTTSLMSSVTTIRDCVSRVAMRTHAIRRQDRRMTASREKGSRTRLYLIIIDNVDINRNVDPPQSYRGSGARTKSRCKPRDAELFRRCSSILSPLPSTRGEREVAGTRSETP